MQMNFYNLSELMFILQPSGVKRVHSESLIRWCGSCFNGLSENNGHALSSK